jgi:hypothetical protein
MSVTSTRRVIVNYSGDVVAQQDEPAANNSSSPGEIENVTLAAGNNTITPPTGATAVTILPPAGNTSLITLKGINGDTGIALHLTDPSSIGLNSAASTFVLNAVAQVIVRLLWS